MSTRASNIQKKNFQLVSEPISGEIPLGWENYPKETPFSNRNWVIRSKVQKHIAATYVDITYLCPTDLFRRGVQAITGFSESSNTQNGKGGRGKGDIFPII